MKILIPKYKLNISQKEVDSITRSARYGTFVIGSEICQFEKELAQLFNRKYCFTSLNGFTAILLSLLALGIKNKKVLLPAVSTCFSMVNAIKASGNTPVFSDVEVGSGNIDVESAKNIMKIDGFSCIVSPNHFGILSNITKLKGLGVPVIEDGAQSFFSNLIGANTSDMLILSFYPTKMINAIDGGAILIDNDLFADKINNLISYRDQLNEESSIRYNFKLPNIHAVVGLQSLARRKKIAEKYQYIANFYSKAVSNSNIVSILGMQNTSKMLLRQFILKFRNEELLLEFIKKMNVMGISSSRELLFITNKNSNFKNAKKIISETCSIPMYEKLSKQDVKYISSSIRQALQEIENGA